MDGLATEPKIRRGSRCLYDLRFKIPGFSSGSVDHLCISDGPWADAKRKSHKNMCCFINMHLIC